MSEFRLQPYPIGPRPHALESETDAYSSLGKSSRPFTQVSGPPTWIQPPPPPQHCHSPGPVPARPAPKGRLMAEPRITAPFQDIALPSCFLRLLLFFELKVPEQSVENGGEPRTTLSSKGEARGSRPSEGAGPGGGQVRVLWGPKTRLGTPVIGKAS